MAYCCSCDPRTDYRLVGDIAQYIADEMSDSRYYAILAAMAPTEFGKDLLTQFSQDEWTHAQRLSRAYAMLTNRVFTPPPIPEPEVPEYTVALKARILAETADYQKYGEKYLAACNPCLKDMFFALRTNEAMHAMRIPILLAGG